MDIVKEQAPASATDADIRDALSKSNGNALDAIALLWNVPPAPTNKSVRKIDEIREICDSFDYDAEKYIKTLKDSESNSTKNGSQSQHP